MTLLQHLQARIRKHPKTQHWQAIFYAYDAAEGRWVRRMKSTKTTSKIKASAIAHELQQFALRAAGQGSDTAITRDYVLDTLNHILRLAGHQTVRESCAWDQYAANWIDLQKRRVTASTLGGNRSAIDHFTQWLGAKKTIPINQITGQMVQAWYGAVLDSGLRPSSGNIYLNVLKRIFKRAHAEGLCDRNPTDLVTRQQNQKSIRETFSVQEIAKILAHLRETKQAEWLTLTLFSLCTAQRLSDCATANWSQITEANGTLVWTITQKKTQNQIAIPIVEPLLSHLQQMATANHQGPIMPELCHLMQKQPSRLSNKFVRILEAAGIQREVGNVQGAGYKITNKSFHCFRHTTNSLMANAGIARDIRRKITGHKSDAMNDHYTHLEMKTTLQALKQGLEGIA